MEQFKADLTVPLTYLPYWSWSDSLWRWWSLFQMSHPNLQRVIGPVQHLTTTLHLMLSSPISCTDSWWSANNLPNLSLLESSNSTWWSIRWRRQCYPLSISCTAGDESITPSLYMILNLSYLLLELAKEKPSRHCCSSLIIRESTKHSSGSEQKILIEDLADGAEDEEITPESLLHAPQLSKVMFNDKKIITGFCRQ